MVHTLEEISRLVRPVAEKYHLKAVYIFGSYARGEAQDDSDVDLLVDLSGADLSEFFAVGGLYNDLEDALQKRISFMTTGSLNQMCLRRSDRLLRNAIQAEMKEIYTSKRGE